MVIVTGVSGGIGKAVAEQYLQDGETVLGLGRNSTITHERYHFQRVNLALRSEVEQLEFDFSDATNVTLINNAGTIGAIERVSEQEQYDAGEVLELNTVAPMLLCHKLLRKLPLSTPLTIVNISSGAALRPIAAWAAYCASKAALNLFSQALYLEEKERGRAIRVYAVAPGVVDTDMQTYIRNANPSTFSALDSFIALKETEQLIAPDEVALKLKRLLENPYDERVVYTLRDL